METQSIIKNNMQEVDLLMAGGPISRDSQPIVFDGPDFIMPVQYQSDPISGAKEFLRRTEAAEEVISQTAEFGYRLNDVRVALARTARLFGSAYSKSGQYKMASEITIKTGYDRAGQMTTIVVPDDWMTIPFTKDGRVRVQAKLGAHGYVGQLEFQFKRFDQPRVNGIIKLVQEMLDTNSIYRGQVIDGALNFIDVTNVDPDALVYKKETKDLLDTWAMTTIRGKDALIRAKLQTKVSMLLAGTYGCGKTVYLRRIAYEAWLAGWTTLVNRPVEDDFSETLETARMYMQHGMGVVIIAEDVESWGFSREKMLDMWDGFGSKSDNALFVVTSNFPDKLDPAMLRPGRLDTVIQIGELDVPSFTKLCQNKLGTLLADDVDYEKAFVANEGYTPAFMVGALESVVRSTINRTGEAAEINTEDLVNAANGFRAQYELQKAAAARKDPLPTFDQVFRETTKEAVQIEDPEIDYEAIENVVNRVVERRLNEASISLETSSGNVIEGHLYTQ